MKQMTAIQLKEFLKTAVSPVLIDVREQEELEFGTFDGIIHIPMHQIPEKLNELDQHKNNTIILICRSGKRSDQVGQFLEQNGFTDVINFQGGMNSWAASIDTSMTVY
jgi:rhodanese-related sulfurtransferase